MEKLEQCVMTVVMGGCRVEIGVGAVTVLRVMVMRQLRGIMKALKTK